MLFTILISVVLVAVIFAIANKYTKKKEQPSIPSTVEEEPFLGYETSSLAEHTYPETKDNLVTDLKSELEYVEPNLVSTDYVETTKTSVKPKAKKKMSAKPKAKTKAPKKKKDA